MLLKLVKMLKKDDVITSTNEEDKL